MLQIKTGVIRKVLHAVSKPLKSIVLCLLILSGCSRPQPPTPSGFLDDYSHLKPSREKPGAMVYVDNSRNLSLYKMIIVEPVVVMLSPDAEAYQKIDPAKLQELARYFEEEIRAVMKESYPIVDKPGFGVLRVRAAITDVQARRSVLGSFIGLGLGGAAIEAELVDAQNDQQVIAFVDSERGKYQKRYTSAKKYGHSRDRLRQWAVMLKDHLDEARGLHRGSKFRSTGYRYRTDW